MSQKWMCVQDPFHKSGILLIASIKQSAITQHLYTQIATYIMHGNSTKPTSVFVIDVSDAPMISSTMEISLSALIQKNGIGSISADVSDT